MGTNTDEKQKTMFDLDRYEISPAYVDMTQKLAVYRNPLHWKAHRLQLLLERLDKQAVSNPAQFNSATYKDILNELESCLVKINEGKIDEADDKGGMDQDRHEGTTSAVGERTPPGMDIGISADNPFSG